MDYNYPLKHVKMKLDDLNDCIGKKLVNIIFSRFRESMLLTFEDNFVAQISTDEYKLFVDDVLYINDYKEIELLRNGVVSEEYLESFKRQRQLKIEEELKETELNQLRRLMEKYGIKAAESTQQ
jgi:hypothetical protein